MAGLKKISWLRKQSGFEQMQMWREKRRAANESYLNGNAELANAFTGAFISRTNGMAELAAKAAGKRVLAQTQAKFAELDKLDLKV
jgi:hypothetical protein